MKKLPHKFPRPPREKLKYESYFLVLGMKFHTTTEAMEHFDCCAEAISKYCRGLIDHPLHHYKHHIEINGVLYRSWKRAAEALNVEPRHIKQYVEGTGTPDMKQIIESGGRKEKKPKRRSPNVP